MEDKITIKLLERLKLVGNILTYKLLSKQIIHKQNINIESIRKSPFNIDYFEDVSNKNIKKIINIYYNNKLDDKYGDDVVGFVLWYDSEYTKSYYGYK